jgi:hypothetical protein
MALPSRTNHGQITARDWFSPGGSESGYIAPDPQDSNIIYLSGVYGSVDRFDLRTSFTQNITPWPVSIFGTEINDRKYRDPWTPVLLFSPFDKKTLYLGTQFVMKTADGGLHWQKISPDLTGATEAGEGKQGADGKPQGPATPENARTRGFGVVFTIAPSNLNGDLIWAGSDTGLIHVTRDGGRTWINVTPKDVSDWSRVALIEASHSNPAEAYAAVDSHRLDDQRPYLYRTRDYGATWQLITNGLSAPSFVRAVREDPQGRGLLFAGTELGIYVSFDDGDHWQSLQLNLPATSVQDMVIHGDDLVIATHGRSFWALDDISPLRQAKEAMQSSDPWLYRPATAVRVDHDGFLGTPLPPEEPAAENPPNGAIVNYFLKSAAAHVRLEILDADGNMVRSFSSDDAVEVNRKPVPIADRWLPKPQIPGKAPGMHRFVWDLIWTGSGEKSQGSESSEEFNTVRGPKVVPGVYALKLTVDGKSWTQPLKVTMDPRSVATVPELAQQYEIGQKMFREAISLSKALAEMHSFEAQVMAAQEKAQGSQSKSELAKADEAIRKILSGTGAHSGDELGLEAASSNIASALHVVESGDRTVPSQATELFEESDRAAKLRQNEWNQLKGTLTSQLQASHAK